MKSIEINGTIYKNPVLVFAMEAEAADEFSDFSRIFTGLGKVNAAIGLMKRLQTHKPDLIINLGTAGSAVFSRKEVVCCTKFIQRDMDVTALGFEQHKTPFSAEEPVLEYGLRLESFLEAVCGTGDSFEMAHQGEIYNVVDMESYALALVAKRENIPFLCLKYISDGADDDAASDWTSEIKNAAKKLRQSLIQE